MSTGIPTELREKAQKENFEIRQTLDGRVFAIRNIRQEFDGNKMIMKAEVAGNMEAGEEFLKTLTNKLFEAVVRPSLPKIREVKS